MKTTKDRWQLIISGRKVWSGRSLFTLIFGYLPLAKPGDLVKIRRLNRVTGRYELQDRTVWPGTWDPRLFEAPRVKP